MASASTPAVVAPPRVRLLPIECLLMIARYSDGATLQNFRQSSKAFQRIADPVLWKEIRLVPNVDCLSRFCGLIAGRSIALHVQTLVYDTSWQSLLDDIKAKHDKTDPAGTDSASSNAAEILSSCIQAHVKSAEGSGAEIGLLTRVLISLPNVHNLKSIERLAPSLGDDHPPPFYRSVCRQAGMKISELRLSNLMGPLRYVSHVRNILLAAYATGRTIETLELVEIPWTTFFQDTNSPTDLSNRSLSDFNLRREVFKGLKNLHVSFRNAPSRDPDTHLRALREILKGCINVESLRLSMTDYIQKKYSTDYRMFSYLAPLVEGRSMKPLMPKLRELHIDSCVCTQNDLISLLSMHASSLRDLTMSNISLLRQEDNDMRGCWVHVIKLMKHALRLDKIVFKEWFSNGGRQRWYVPQDTTVDENRLRPKVERFVRRQSTASCPIPLEVVAVRSGHEDVPKPKNGVEEEGDWTWTMTYGQSKSRYDRSESTFSGTDLFSKDVPLDNDVSEDIPVWDDWDFAKPEAQHSKYAIYQKVQSKIKGKPTPPPTYTFTPGGLPTGGFCTKDGSTGNTKQMLLEQKPIAASSCGWGSFCFQNMGSTAQEPWFSSSLPTPPSHHSGSSSSKSTSTTSTNSQPQYTEEDINFDDISYKSPSQNSLSQPNPPYTPSYSSHASNGSFDTFASWSQAPPSYHSSDISVAAPGGSNSASSKGPSHSIYNHHSITWDDAWADPFNFSPPSGASMKSPPPPAHSLPTFMGLPYTVDTQQAQSIVFQPPTPPTTKGVSPSDAIAFLSHKPMQMQTFSAYTTHNSAAKYQLSSKPTYHKPPATPAQELPFGITVVQDTLMDEPVEVAKQHDEDLKKKAGIETYDPHNW